MVIAKYTNGNTTVTILHDGTKIREYENDPEITHPESIDVKITDYCDMGCAYCHESSTTKGIHADLDKLLDVISELPAGVELAIGGGNPLSHPKLVDFLQVLKARGIIANITVNQGHLKAYQDLLTYLIKDELVRGVGISITSNNFKYIKPLLLITNNIVYHLIAGVNKVEVIDKLIKLGNCKVLVLGYKYFGFGVNYHSKKVDTELKQWYKQLPKLIGKCTLSFDNLAIEQLNVKRLFTEEGWERFYMGDDFCFTMYIDAVKQEYAPTSRSAIRKSFADCTLLEYFSSRGCATEQNGKGCR
jgi:MoaA/NifB/PqqE/SkfB family radical SAM enzyme